MEKSVATNAGGAAGAAGAAAFTASTAFAGASATDDAVDETADAVDETADAAAEAASSTTLGASMTASSSAHTAGTTAAAAAAAAKPSIPRRLSGTAAMVTTPDRVAVAGRAARALDSAAGAPTKATMMVGDGGRRGGGRGGEKRQWGSGVVATGWWRRCRGGDCSGSVGAVRGGGGDAGHSNVGTPAWDASQRHARFSEIGQGLRSALERYARKSNETNRSETFQHKERSSYVKLEIWATASRKFRLASQEYAKEGCTLELQELEVTVLPLILGSQQDFGVAGGRGETDPSVDPLSGKDVAVQGRDRNREATRSDGIRSVHH